MAEVVVDGTLEAVDLTSGIGSCFHALPDCSAPDCAALDCAIVDCDPGCAF